MKKTMLMLIPTWFLLFSFDVYKINRSGTYPWSLDYFLKTLFVYHRSGEVLDEFSLLDGLAVDRLTILLLICVIVLLVDFFCFSSNYRGMVMHRFSDKNEFLSHYLLKSLKVSLVVTGTLTASILAGFYLAGGFRSIAQRDITGLGILLVNIFVFINLCVLINSFLVLKYHEMISMLLVFVMTFIFVYISVLTLRIEFVTYGDIPALAKGTVVEIIAYIGSFFFLRRSIKNMDML